MRRENRTKRAIREGRLVVGMYSDSLHPAFVELMAKAGVDFVILDTEHNGYGVEHCTECVRAAESWDVTPLIRVYDNNPRLINKALEIGAMGVVVPHVDTPALAAQAVAAAKYPPEGVRGVHPLSRAAGYAAGREAWERAWRQANDEVMVVLQPLESEAGVANIEQIAAVPGVDLISIGIGDLSQVLGAPMQPDHPRVRAVRDRAWESCRRSGVGTYALVGGVEEMRRWYDKGVRVFVCGSDIGLFQRQCTSFVRSLREVAG